MLVVGGSGLLSLVVPLLVVPMYRRLSESLGAAGPSVLQGWIPVVLGLFPMALLAYALAVPQPLMRRRMLLVLAFALTVLASAVILIALYATLFNLAGAATGP